VVIQTMLADSLRSGIDHALALRNAYPGISPVTRTCSAASL